MSVFPKLNQATISRFVIAYPLLALFMGAIGNGVTRRNDTSPDLASPRFASV